MLLVAYLHTQSPGAFLEGDERFQTFHFFSMRREPELHRLRMRTGTITYTHTNNPFLQKNEA